MMAIIIRLQRRSSSNVGGGIVLPALVSSCSYILVLLLVLSVSFCNASAPVAVPTTASHINDDPPANGDTVIGNSADGAGSSLQCDSGREEDDILCGAHAQQDDVIRQVQDEDETAASGDEDGVDNVPSADKADAMWQAAYRQWVSGGGGGGVGVDDDNDGKNNKKKTTYYADDEMITSAEQRKAVIDTARRHQQLLKQEREQERQLEAQRAHARDTINHLPNKTTTEHHQLNEDEQQHSERSERQPHVPTFSTATDDDSPPDELKLITQAAAILQKTDAATTNIDRLSALELVIDLCVSGDNGRQFAASDGVSSVLQVMREHGYDNALVHTGLRALGTCAQNNAPVIAAAVRAGAVAEAARIGVRQRDNEVGRAAALKAVLAMAVDMNVDADADLKNGDGDGDVDDVDESMTMNETETETETETEGKTKSKTKTMDVVWSAREDILAMVRASFKDVGSGGGVDMRRCKIRSLALMDACLMQDRSRWESELRRLGMDRLALAAMKDEDVDVREGAARVVRLLRSSSSTT